MKKYCVIGCPIAHSLSPKLHNSWFKKIGLSARYTAVEVQPEELERFMRDFRKIYSGANVTIPHKEKIIQYLDGLTAEAREIGAVNAIVNKKGKLIGYNTDVFGAMSALKTKCKSLKNKRAIVLGAGGAARAIVYGLKRAGAKVVVLNRTVGRAKKLAREFGCEYGVLQDFGRCSCDIVVNATSVGMWGKNKIKDLKVLESPMPDFARIISKRAKKPVAMDIVYRPKMTRFLKDAKKAGCAIITGDKMFLMQAAASFGLWTGYFFKNSAPATSGGGGGSSGSGSP